MNDFDYEALQKKRIGYGAAHKKGRRKGCTLPSDHLTAAEKKARNGEMKSYHLDLPMTWEDFKTMPKDLQSEYIRSLQSRFDVGLSNISRDLFDLSRTSLAIYMKKNGISYNAPHRGGALDTAVEAVWKQWIEQDAPLVRDDDKEGEQKPQAEAEEILTVCESAEAPAEKIAAAPAEEITAAPAEAGFGLDRISVEFHGEFDAENFLRYLSGFRMPSGRVRVHVEVTAE